MDISKREKELISDLEVAKEQIINFEAERYELTNMIQSLEDEISKKVVSQEHSNRQL